jgi:hypothetical protein
MAVVRWENTFAASGGNSIVYDAAYGAATADGYASGGDYRAYGGGVAGKPITITVATASGFTGAIMGCTSSSTSSHAITFTVDGGSVQTWDQNPSGANVSDANYTQYRQVSQPIFLVGNGVHTIIVNSPASGFITFDFIDLFTAVVPATPARYHIFGHSYVYSVLNSSNNGRWANRFPLQIANYLGMAEDNYGNPAADLTNGSYHAGSPYTTTRFYNQTAHYIPDWMRAEAGANWPASSGVLNPLDKGAAWLADAPYGPQWGARAPKRAGIMHGLNDAGLELVYEVNGAAIGASFRNLAGTATITSPLAAGTVMRFFIDRLRGMIARMLLEVPTIDCIDIFGIANAFNGTLVNMDLYRRWSDATEAMCKESWIPARKVMYVPLLDATTQGGGIAVSNTDGHPNEHGHYVIFDAWRRTYEAQKRATAASGIAH